MATVRCVRGRTLGCDYFDSPLDRAAAALAFHFHAPAVLPSLLTPLYPSLNARGASLIDEEQDDRTFLTKKVEDYKPITITTMGYLQDADAWLNEVLKHLPIDHLDEAKKQIRAKILESYKNGIREGQAGGNKKAKTSTSQ